MCYGVWDKKNGVFIKMKINIWEFLAYKVFRMPEFNKENWGYYYP